MDQFDRDNQDFWKWGILYNNPGDPSVWVTKRYGFGWTLNYAHQAAYWWTALILILPVTAILSSIF